MADRILIASDIHGSATAATILMQRIEEFGPDRVILLGDLLYHGPRNDLPDGYAPKQVIPMLNSIAGMARAVRGNCDAEVDQMVLEFSCMDDYACLDIDGMRALATHGHLAEERLADGNAQNPVIRMSGHTHVKILEKRDGIIWLNPGSTSIPKDGSASYATYADGTFALHALDGTVLRQLGC